MADFGNEIDAALLTDEPLSREKVVLWIDCATDIANLSKLYRLTDKGYYRIQPDLGPDVTCALIQRYLLECIRQNVTENDEIMDRWEAAQTLHVWLCHLLEMKNKSPVLQSAAQGVTELFLASGEEIGNAIEQGFLEHALEMEGLRPYFEHWSSDARLQDAWGRAIEWGLAHPNFTWGLLQQLRKATE